MTDKENVVYTQNRILFSLEKDGNSVLCHNTDEISDIMLSEKRKLKKSKVYNSIYMTCLIQSNSQKQSRRVTARRSGEGETGSCCSKGIELKSQRQKSSTDPLYNNVHIFNNTKMCPENTLKIIIYVFFTTIKKHVPQVQTKKLKLQIQFENMKQHYKLTALAKINKTNTPSMGELVSNWNSYIFGGNIK